MGTRGIQIVGMDVNELLTLLNKAFADEWLAYYQYWLGAKVIKGPMKDEVAAELLQHATEELAHADRVALRILQLGGTPVTSPKAWYEHANCGYEAPDNPHVRALLEQNIAGEQCAISVYNDMLAKTRDGDPVTHNMALEILQDELEHEEDLQSLLEDLDMMMQKA